MKGMIHTEEDEIASRYQIKGYIGAGGMQEVYRAFDTILEREVALKVPKSTAAERRFKDSAILSARVNHPNTAKTLDYVVHDGRQYLIEELVEGQDLSKLRERVPVMDPYSAAHLLHHIIKGVAASHHVEVVHRDLKPSNIIVSPGVSFAVVKVTDFGIAKMAEGEIADAVEGGDESISSSSTMMGAIPYLSPEMADNPREAGKPADIWAVGAMTYELVTGNKPFGKGLKALKKIEKAEFPIVPPMVTQNPQFKGLAEELLQVVRKCLVMKPSARPTADQLVKLCESLCYPMGNREEGSVTNTKFDSYGFISATGNTIFFNMDSVYGELPAPGTKVYFSRYSGQPRDRAHPVVKLAEPKSPSKINESKKFTMNSDDEPF